MNTMQRQLRMLWGNLLALAFRLLYQELAWTYDAVSHIVSLGAWRAWQFAALDYLAGTAVLELGHGPGHILLHLSRAGYTVSGVDRSVQMSRIAARGLQQAGLPVRLVRGTAQELPFSLGAFDNVLATFPTEYIVDPATLGAVSRVLRENGRLIIVPEAQLTGSSVWARGLEVLYRVSGQRRSPAPRAAHQGPPANWSLFRSRLSAAGFVVMFHEVDLPGSRVTVVVATKGTAEANRS